MAPVMMCWYNPSPIPKSEQHPAVARRLKTNLNEAPVSTETQRDVTNSRVSDNRTKKELIDENIMRVKLEHLKIKDIDAELCTHVIYNYGILQEDFSVVIKSGDRYLDANRTEGKDNILALIFSLYLYVLSWRSFNLFYLFTHTRTHHTCTHTHTHTRARAQY